MKKRIKQDNEHVFDIKILKRSPNFGLLIRSRNNDTNNRETTTEDIMNLNEHY